MLYVFRMILKLSVIDGIIVFIKHDMKRLFPAFVMITVEPTLLPSISFRPEWGGKIKIIPFL